MRRFPLREPDVAPDLAPYAGELAGAVDLLGVRIDGGEEPAELRGLALEACEVHRLGIAPGVLGGLRLTDVVLADCDLANVRSRGAELRRVALRGVRAVGLVASESSWKEVRVTGGTLALGSLGDARLDRVVFEDVDLREASFLGAHLVQVVFDGCRLTGADFREARLEDCVIRGTTLDGILGIECLRGVAMPWEDLVGSAAALASTLGIGVEE